MCDTMPDLAQYVNGYLRYNASRIANMSPQVLGSNQGKDKTRTSRTNVLRSKSALGDSSASTVTDIPRHRPESSRCGRDEVSKESRMSSADSIASTVTDRQERLSSDPRTLGSTDFYVSVYNASIISSTGAGLLRDRPLYETVSSRTFERPSSGSIVGSRTSDSSRFYATTYNAAITRTKRVQKVRFVQPDLEHIFANTKQAKNIMLIIRVIADLALVPIILVVACLVLAILFDNE